MKAKSNTLERSRCVAFKIKRIKKHKKYKNKIKRINDSTDAHQWLIREEKVLSKLMYIWKLYVNNKIMYVSL